MSQPGDRNALRPDRLRIGRTRHRDRSHDSAHEGLDEPHDSPGGKSHREHPLIPRGNAPLIETQSDFDALIAMLRAARSFTFDSEFIGELTYTPKLCLVQVATATQIALIDPLAGINLTAFWELVADPAVEKIVHAGQQDVEPVLRHLGRPAQNIFDTQIAAGFIGLKYPLALSKLVLELTGIKIGKGLTFTHWDQRPLSGMQLRYAADDVRYLPLLRHEIGQRLDQLGHAQWASQEAAAMSGVPLYQFDPETSFLRVRGATSLHPQALAVLRELAIWRDSAARAHDVPPRALLKDEVMIDLARQPVKSIDKLARVRGLPRPVEQSHGEEIVAATLRGLATPAERFASARSIEPSPADRFRADALWAVAQCICAARGIDPDLVTSRQEIGAFYAEQPADSPILHGWRREVLGKPLQQFLRGELDASLRWQNAALAAELRRRV